MSEVDDIVRRQDRDRYLSTFFAPDDKRPHLMALYAFNGTTLTAVTGAISSPAATVAVAFSPVGNYLAISHNASPYLAFYKRNGSSFTALTTGIPASSGTAYARSIGWTGYGDYFVLNTSTPAVRVWKIGRAHV